LVQDAASSGLHVGWAVRVLDPEDFWVSLAKRMLKQVVSALEHALARLM
jgi:hypothetical protein